eukprot:tig00000459_g1072.t1
MGPVGVQGRPGIRFSDGVAGDKPILTTYVKGDGTKGRKGDGSVGDGLPLPKTWNGTNIRNDTATGSHYMLR